MPLYDYHCTGCEADFELLIRSDTVLECPHCHGARLERKLSLPARVAAGGGPRETGGAGETGGGCCGGACHNH